jgi:hypothetical protein
MAEQTVKQKQALPVVDQKDLGERVCHYTAKTWGEVRKVTDVVIKITDDKTKQEKEYHHLDLACDDENADRFFLQDKDMSHASLYGRGVSGTFTLRIDVEDKFRGKTKIQIVGFEKDKE